MLNLYIGVLIYHFGEAQAISLQNSVLLTDNQKIWAKMQNLIANVDLKRVNPHRKRTFLRRIIKSYPFEFFIYFCIIGNTVILSMNYEGSYEEYNKILGIFNYVFTGVYIVEFLIKILALGIRNYFKRFWNDLDFIITFLSVLDLILLTDHDNDFMRKGPQIFRLFRIIRVMRIVKLVKTFEGMNKIMMNLIKAIWTISDVALLLALIFYIFAVLGVFLFKDITQGAFIDDNYHNFKNFGSAMMLLIGTISGQSWSTAMFDCFNTSPDCIEGVNCGTSKMSFF